MIQKYSFFGSHFEFIFFCFQSIRDFAHSCFKVASGQRDAFVHEYKKHNSKEV